MEKEKKERKITQWILAKANNFNTNIEIQTFGDFDAAYKKMKAELAGEAMSAGGKVPFSVFEQEEGSWTSRDAVYLAFTQISAEIFDRNMNRKTFWKIQKIESVAKAE